MKASSLKAGLDQVQYSTQMSERIGTESVKTDVLILIEIHPDVELCETLLKFSKQLVIWGQEKKTLHLKTDLCTDLLSFVCICQVIN